MLTAVAVMLSSAVCASGAKTEQGVRYRMRPAWEMSSLAAQASPKGYTPDQIKTAYGIGSSVGTGKGKTIAIVVAYGNPGLAGDLASFDARFALPQAETAVHSLGAAESDSDWAIETSLDAEWAHVMAPDAKLLVVEAASDDSADLLAAVDDATNSGAQIVVMSWGSEEHPLLASQDVHFSNSGTVYLAAAGDGGVGAVWPASSPNVISVGGTTLVLDSSGNRLRESAWRSSGGGPSSIERAPSWQTLLGIRSAARSTPDVSFDADAATGVSVYCSGSSGSGRWYCVGGTSLGAPSWGGIIADLNQNQDYIKNAGSLYVLAGSTDYLDPGGCFYDVTTGSNGLRAAAGYDEVTGLGSPDGMVLKEQAALDAAALSAVTDVTGTAADMLRRTPSKPPRVGVLQPPRGQRSGK